MIKSSLLTYDPANDSTPGFISNDQQIVCYESHQSRKHTRKNTIRFVLGLSYKGSEGLRNFAENENCWWWASNTVSCGMKTKEEGRSSVLLPPRLSSLCFVMPLLFISVLSTGREAYCLSNPSFMGAYWYTESITNVESSSLLAQIPMLSLCQVAVKWFEASSFSFPWYLSMTGVSSMR